MPSVFLFCLDEVFQNAKKGPKLLSAPTPRNTKHYIEVCEAEFNQKSKISSWMFCLVHIET